MASGPNPSGLRYWPEFGARGSNDEDKTVRLFKQIINLSKHGIRRRVGILPQEPRPRWRGLKSHTHRQVPDPSGAEGSVS